MCQCVYTDGKHQISRFSFHRQTGTPVYWSKGLSSVNNAYRPSVIVGDIALRVQSYSESESDISTVQPSVIITSIVSMSDNEKSNGKMVEVLLKFSVVLV